jgi:hypothetical protein
MNHFGRSLSVDDWIYRLLQYVSLRPKNTPSAARPAARGLAHKLAVWPLTQS